MNEKITDTFLLDSKIKEEIEKIKLKDLSTSRIEKSELPVPTRPKNFIDFPDDITEIPSQELGKYLAIYQAFSSWTRYLISRREIDLKHGKILIKYVYAKLYEQSTGTNKKNDIEANVFYVNAQLDLLEIESDIDQLTAILESYKEYSSSISREITNRKSLQDAAPEVRINKTFEDGVFGGKKFNQD